MAGERTIPILPCGDVDVILAFYAALGFTKTYRQLKPNPCAAVARDDIHLQFGGIPQFDPANSYGSCIVEVPDADALYKSFAEGLRKMTGKLPIVGIPRMTRPRKRNQAVYGFTVIDPGGNWIRVTQRKAPKEEPTSTAKGLTRVLENAVMLGESHGDPKTAAKLLDKSLELYADASPIERVRALVYRAELAIALADATAAKRTLAEARSIVLSAADRESLDADFDRADELERDLAD